jgi:hypothetical protein
VKQINCKNFKGIVVDALYNYDELSEKDKRLFQVHLTACPGCAVEYEEMAAVLGVMDQRQRPEMAEEFWDSYMLRLQEKLNEAEKKEKKKIWSWLKKWWENFNFDIQLLRWVLYPAAALLLVVLGIAIGRYLYLPSVPGKGEELISSALPLERKISPAVADHFGNLRPMLIDYANYTAGENETSEEELVTVDKKTLKKLVLQNYLLKKIAARENDLSLKQLLVDLEMILLEISNIETNSGRKETIRRVRDILDQCDILFKMKVYNKHKNNRKTLRTSTI